MNVKSPRLNSDLGLIMIIIDIFRETLNIMVLSFPRKRKPSQINKLDSRFRGNDDLFSISLDLLQNSRLK
jgi:hypothetical protein